MQQKLTAHRLYSENLAFGGTGGISWRNKSQGFVPAFFDRDSGRVALSRFADGALAPVHLLEGLPETWVVARDAGGGIKAVKASVIAGFVRDGHFYTRQQAAQAELH